MKNILLFFIFLLFLDGVFGESVSVMEGDSVTLNTDLTEIQKEDVIDWRFGSDLIARINRPVNKNEIFDDVLHGKFKDRLKLQEQNGDLTIRNIRTTDSGDYKVTIHSEPMIFSVKVVPADAVKSVTVNEGDSVALHTGLTVIQRDDVIRWRFEQQESPVAEINRKAGIFSTSDGPDGRFKGRLRLDHQTGSLNITNIITTHSGLYEVEISRTSSRYTIHHTQSFNVTVSADVKSVSVMVGDSVTLRTGLTETQRIEQILWKFGDHDELIARLNGTVNKIWRNIDLNIETGDLTIRNLRRDQHGDYKVEIITRRMILHSKYGITIDAGKPVSVKEGETVTLQTVTEIQKDDEILWMFRDTVVAEIYKASQPFYKDDVLDGRFRDRLQLDHQTGSLTITNTRTTDSGDYKLVISSSRHIINSRCTVTVSGSGLSRGAVAGIVVGVLLAAAVVAGVVFYYRRKISELERPREENGGNHKKQDTDVPANEETELYSEEPIE